MLVALGAYALGPVVAHAQEPIPDEERAKELYNNGRQLYEEGRYEDAIAAWEEAYRVSNRALLLFNIANAYERIGAYQSAIDSLSRYRAFAPEDEREALERRLRNLELRLAEQQAVAAQVVRPPDPAPVVPEPEPTPKERVSVVPWLVVGAGGVAIASGLGIGSAALGARADASGLCATNGICPEEASTLIKKDRTLSLAADLTTGLGVATAGTGVLLVALTSGTGPRFAVNHGGSTSWSVHPWLASPGLTVDVRR
jgi:tetratricopeptide (TPR) repeat protein